MMLKQEENSLQNYLKGKVTVKII